MKYFNHKILLASLMLFCHLLIFSKSDLMAVSENTFTNNQQNYQKNWVAVNKDFYYEYTALANGKQLYVTIIDQSLKTFILTFAKDNYLFLRATYRNFIIVEQKQSPNMTVSYWVITIQRQIDNQSYKYVLDSFNVSSTIDNVDFKLENDYTLTSIIEYRQQTKFLYVILQYVGDTDVYGIDIGNRGGQMKRLIAISWFYINKEKPQVIIGGNSRVLVQNTQSLIYIDTNNTRNNDSDPTVFNQKPISSFTSLTIYNISRVFNLVDWYFQYTSLSLDHLQFTGIVFYGYNGETYGDYSMNSTTAIKYFADEYNFFMAVGSDDIYLTIVQWDEQKQDYSNTTELLSGFLKDKQRLKSLVSILNQAWYVVYIGRYFYVLGQQQFYVFDTKANFQQVSLKENVLQFEDLTYRAMKEIKRFRANTK